MDRKKVQKILDDYFYNIGINCYFSREKSTKKENEYIVFYLSNGTDDEFSDNNVLIKSKNIYINYYSIDVNNLDKRSKEIVSLMRNNGFNVIDDGTDIPSEINADIWGISMEFSYESII